MVCHPSACGLVQTEESDTNCLALCFLCGSFAHIVQCKDERWTPLFLVCNDCDLLLGNTVNKILGLPVDAESAREVIMQSFAGLSEEVNFPEQCTIHSALGAAAEVVKYKSCLCYGPLVDELGLPQLTMSTARTGEEATGRLRRNRLRLLGKLSVDQANTWGDLAFMFHGCRWDKGDELNTDEIFLLSRAIEVDCRVVDGREEDFFGYRDLAEKMVQNLRDPVRDLPQEGSTSLLSSDQTVESVTDGPEGYITVATDQGEECRATSVRLLHGGSPRIVLHYV